MARVLAQPELETFPALEWSDIAPRLSRESRTALERVMETLDGGVLTREQCSRLANADGDDLLGLLVAADALRRELVGNIVTYVVNRNINFTNVCFVGCKFCAFSRGPREADTYFLSLEQVAQKAVEAWEIGLSLGLLVVAIGLSTWVAARIYGAGVLLYGQRPGFRTFLRVAMRPGGG